MFINEAYALSSDKGGFGQEAIDTLVKLIEDYRGEIVVILAGYKKEMTDFMKSNSGLESRFPLVIDFPDYKPDELYAIALKMISARGFTITEDAKGVLKEQIVIAHISSTAYSGNGRMVRNMIEKIMRNQSARIASIENISKGGLTEAAKKVPGYLIRNFFAGVITILRLQCQYIFRKRCASVVLLFYQQADIP